MSTLEAIIAKIQGANTIEELAEIEAEGFDWNEPGYYEMKAAIDQRIDEFVKGVGN